MLDRDWAPKMWHDLWHVSCCSCALLFSGYTSSLIHLSPDAFVHLIIFLSPPSGNQTSPFKYPSSLSSINSIPGLRASGRVISLNASDSDMWAQCQTCSATCRENKLEEIESLIKTRSAVRSVKGLSLTLLKILCLYGVSKSIGRRRSGLIFSGFDACRFSVDRP